MGYAEPLEEVDAEPRIHTTPDACPGQRLAVVADAIQVLDGGAVVRSIPLQDNAAKATLLPDGGAVVAYDDYEGVARLDAEGRHVWHRQGRFHHDAEVTLEGVWTYQRRGPAWLGARAPEWVQSEWLVLLDLADGATVREWRLDGLVGSVTTVVDPVDRYHPNTVVAQPDGSLVLTLREVNAVVHLDPWTGTVRQVWDRDFDALHAATPRGGELLVFDNGNQRAVIVDAGTEEVLWSHPVDSDTHGHVSWTPCGTVLVSDPKENRAFEVTRDGEVVWEYSGVLAMQVDVL